MEIPRHLQPSAPSSNQSSPIGTPPTSNSQPRSPAGSQTALPQPTPSPLPGTAAPPLSPSLSSNRFGLALNFIQRRPRGSTNPLAMGSPGRTGAPGGRSPSAGSPTSELPPSPNGGERERTGGYGFPALRRTLSRRAAGSGNSPSDAPPSRTRNQQRSASQPPGHHGERDAEAGSADSFVVLEPPQPAFAGLTPSASLPLTQSNGHLDAAGGRTSEEKHRLRLVPHLESSRSLHFDPVDRDLASFDVLRVGRFTDRSQPGSADPLRIAFKSKVVSRGHAEIWCDDSGKFFIKDTKSSSGTFLNHIRLSGPGSESRPFPLKDGDILQLGVDYQGGTEEIYRCVKMRVELNRGWQRGMNSFNTNALAQLRALGGGPQMDVAVSSTSMSAAPTQKVAAASASSVTDCCICLYPVTVCQALFIAPCSHVTHFKCIRPLVNQNYPGFSCPLCRTYADLEADVEIEPWEPEVPLVAAPQPATVTEEDEPGPSDDDEVVNAEPVPRAGSIRALNAATDSRRSSLQISGLDGVPVPFLVAEHRRPLLVSAPAPGDVVAPSLPLPIAVPASNSEFEDSVYQSLAEAATPPNSTFLSTLADSGLFGRHQTPVSLDMALDHFTSGSSDPGPSAARADQLERGSSGSEDGTDGPRDEDESDTGKGKRVVGRPKEVVKDVLGIDVDGVKDTLLS